MLEILDKSQTTNDGWHTPYNILLRANAFIFLLIMQIANNVNNTLISSFTLLAYKFFL